MITGEMKSQIDKVWNDFWAGGVSNPLAVVEQITYLLFIKRLDEVQAAAEAKAAGLGKKPERTVFPDGKDGLETPQFQKGGCPYELMRWSQFKNKDPKLMMEIVADHVFPFLRTMGTDGSTLSRHMNGARLGFSSPNLLVKAVEGLDSIKMDARDTKGDVYEYMLSKIASAGQNGQFRTPRHIIELMVHMTKPTQKDMVCDPAAGTAGFLVFASEYLREMHPEIFRKDASRKHFFEKAFTGYEFDETMLRIGAMNMMLHGLDNPNITYRDSLQEGSGDDADAYTLILANPPFAGSLDYDACAKDLQKVVKTKKTELLFLALFLRLLKTGGRAAVIVPDGVLFGSSKAHKTLRELLVEEHKLDAVVSLPSGVFKPYAGVSTAILFFTKTGIGGTDHVWYYDMKADGQSLDDKRTRLVDDEFFGPAPETALPEELHEKNNLPDVLARWESRDGDERKRPRTAQSFCVPKEEIAAAGYDLSINRYKEEMREEIKYDPPKVILKDLRKMEKDIAKGLDKLEEMLG